MMIWRNVKIELNTYKQENKELKIQKLPTCNWKLCSLDIDTCVTETIYHALYDFLQFCIIKD